MTMTFTPQIIQKIETLRAKFPAFPFKHLLIQSFLSTCYVLNLLKVTLYVC
jgi:hypothetical protein